MLSFHRIGATVKSDLDHKDEAVKPVLEIVKKSGAEVLVDDTRCQDLPSAKGMAVFEDEKNLDLLIVIGGDGTMLRAVRQLKDFSIPILSINRGAVGFMAETNMDEAAVLLPKLLQGEGVIDERSVLHVEAKRGEEKLFHGNVLNEAVISQG